MCGPYFSTREASYPSMNNHIQARIDFSIFLSTSLFFVHASLGSRMQHISPTKPPSLPINTLRGRRKIGIFSLSQVDSYEIHTRWYTMLQLNKRNVLSDDEQSMRRDRHDLERKEKKRWPRNASCRSFVVNLAYV